LLKPSEDFPHRRPPAGVDVRKAFIQSSIERSQAFLAFLDEPHALADNFTLRVIAAVFDKLGNGAFELLAQIDAAWHGNFLSVPW
jgi:hypothetical protein